MIDIEKKVCYTHISREKGSCHTMSVGVSCWAGRAHKEVSGWSGGRRRRKSWQEPILWFLWKGTGKAVLTCLGLASLSNFNRLLETEAVPGYLVPGPGVIRVSDWPRVWESVKKGGWGYGLWTDWFALERSDHEWVFSTLMNWLTLEEPVPPGSSKPQDGKASE